MPKKKEIIGIVIKILILKNWRKWDAREKHGAILKLPFREDLNKCYVIALLLP